MDSIKIVVIFIIVLLFIYYIFKSKFDISKFGFNNYSKAIVFGNSSDLTDNLLQPPNGKINIQNDIISFSPNYNSSHILASTSTLPQYSICSFMESQKILWLFPNASSDGKDSSQIQRFDTLINTVNLNKDDLTVFNWFMNQDSINTYMSDIYTDIDYNNNSESNPSPPNGFVAPLCWSGPYVTQSIGGLLYGINGNDHNIISKSSALITIIGNYTNLYSYICGQTGGSINYGLANIKVGTKSDPVSPTTPPFNWNGSSGAFNDSTFYKKDTTGISQSDFTLSGTVKHAVWSILLARQNQLVQRLDPAIIATL